MNWDEQLIEDCLEPDGTMHPHTDHVMSGAHWMLRKLRTDEAVERVARALVGVTFSAEEPAELEKLKDSRWDAFEEDARAAITALLGEDA